jgi:hypothetical protein
MYLPTTKPTMKETMTNKNRIMGITLFSPGGLGGDRPGVETDGT